MDRIKFDKCLAAMSLIGAIGTITRNIYKFQKGDDQTFGMQEDVFEELTSRVDQLVELFSEVDAPLSLSCAKRLQEYLPTARTETNSGATFHVFRGQRLGDYQTLLSELSTIPAREFEARLVYVLASNAVIYNPGDLPCGEDVEKAFTNAEDLVEAANCLALGRYTACVFHLMRAMEIAVKTLAVTLNINIIRPDGVDKNWGNILNEFQSKIQGLTKTDQPKWQECYALLSSANSAWRNQTMHPKKTYTQEEAAAVYAAVKAFMIDLAPLV